MIKFHDLNIENFLSVAKASLNLNDQGLVLIEGVNKDDPTTKSNGAGKSSVVDAISWVLYGETARGGSGDSVVNIKAGKGTAVNLKFEADGKMYLIRRGRKHKELKNRVQLLVLDDATTMSYSDLTLGTDRLTQERINNLLGCTPDIFKASIYMGQEVMPDLPGMTDKMLKGILEEALSLDKLDEALEVCKGRYATALHTATLAHQRLALLESEDRNVREDIAACGTALDAAEHDLIDLDSQRNRLATDFGSQQDAHEAAAAVLRDRLAACPPDDLRAVTGAIESTVATIMSDVKVLNGETELLRDKLSSARYEINSLTARYDAVETKCPTCNRDHDDAAAAAVERDKGLARIKEIEAAMSQSKSKLKELEKERSAVIKTADDYRCSEMAKYEVATRTRKEIEALQHSAEIEFARDQTQFQVGIANLDRITKAKRQTVEELSQRHIDLTNELDRITNRIVKNAVERDDANQRVEVLEKVKHIMSRKGFRGEVLDQITPYLNARTHHYLSQLTDDNISAVWNTVTMNAAGDYVESFHIAVRHKSGVDKFALLSGGEKRKVRLATAMALQDLVGTRAIKPIKLFIADEIDDAIDETGLELLMGVLETKAREVGTVFVISHNDLKSWVRNKITVVKKDGQTTFVTP